MGKIWTQFFGIISKIQVPPLYKGEVLTMVRLKCCWYAVTCDDQFTVFEEDVNAKDTSEPYVLHVCHMSLINFVSSNMKNRNTSILFLYG